jgi:hypothetical protein
MYIGKTPTVGNFQKCDDLNASATADYTLQVSSTNVVPESVNHMIVSLNGVIQEPGATGGFTVSGATLSFASALTSNDTIDFVILLGNVLDIGTPSDATVSNAKLASDLISGETDIGGAIADADLFLLDDGAGGTLRKTAASRIKTYAASNNFTDNITIADDKGVTFGDDSDFHIGCNAGETVFQIQSGSDISTLQYLGFRPTADGTYLDIISSEAKGSSLDIVQDNGDDNGDHWAIGQGAPDGDANEIIIMSNDDSGSQVHKARLYTNGNWLTSGTHAASQSFDYAEYFEWKTALANDAKITETYGMTVVLDNGKVRLAEVGEEAKVIGVVRPNSTSTMVGGGQEIQYKNKYEKNIWGEPVYEEYTLVDWDETRTKDDGSTYVYHHKYMKDRIPSKVIRNGAIKNEENWHTLESNFEKDKDGNFITLVIPTTAEEKIAANYVERTEYLVDKGEHKKGDKLLRPKISSSYDFTKTYEGRDKRRKEWCIVGLIGQVEIRDTAIIPTSWTKMKNLDTGIDLYYIK